MVQRSDSSTDIESWYRAPVLSIDAIYSVHVGSESKLTHQGIVDEINRRNTTPANSRAAAAPAAASAFAAGSGYDDSGGDEENPPPPRPNKDWMRSLT